MPHILPSGSISCLIFLLLFATSINSQLLQKRYPVRLPVALNPLVGLKRRRGGRHVIGQSNDPLLPVPGPRGGNVVLCAAISEHGVLRSTSNNAWYWAQFEPIWTVSKQEFGPAGRARGSVNGDGQSGLELQLMKIVEGFRKCFLAIKKRFYFSLSQRMPLVKSAVRCLVTESWIIAVGLKVLVNRRFTRHLSTAAAFCRPQFISNVRLNPVCALSGCVLK